MNRKQRAQLLGEAQRQSDPEGIVELLYALEQASANRLAARVIAGIDNQNGSAWEKEDKAYREAFSAICDLARRLMNERDEWKQKAETAADNFDDLLRGGVMRNG